MHSKIAKVTKTDSSTVGSKCLSSWPWRSCCVLSIQPFVAFVSFCRESLLSFVSLMCRGLLLPLVDLEVEDKRLFFDQEIIVEIIITSLLKVFASEAFDRVDILPEG